MKLSLFLVLLLASVGFAQDANTTLPTTGPSIAEGAHKSFTDLQMALKTVKGLYADEQAKVDRLTTDLAAAKYRVQVLEMENADLRAQLRALPAKEPTPAAKITQVSTDNCPHCVDSENYHEPRYKAATWIWAGRKERMRPGVSYPYWEICIGNVCEAIHIPDWHNLDDAVKAKMASINKQPFFRKGLK